MSSELIEDRLQKYVMRRNKGTESNPEARERNALMIEAISTIRTLRRVLKQQE